MAGENIQQTPQRLYKGINTDVSPIDQGEGTYRFALNAVNETREGDLNFLSTEESNKEFTELTHGGNNYIPIGSIYVDDNEHVVFGVTQSGDKAIVMLILANGESEVIIDDDTNSCLNFSLTDQIQGEYRLRNGCEKTIYWVDGRNQPKTINLSEDYSNVSCLDLNLVKTVKTYPRFESVEVQSGGMLPSGTYNFAIQYVDENGNETAWLTTSQTVAIYVDTRAGEYDGVNGSSNNVTQVQNLGEYLFGSPPTSKQILITLSNLSSDYEFYRLAAIEAISGTGIPTRTLVTENIPITQTTYVHDGNLDRYTEIPTEDVLLPMVDVGIPKHIEQVEDRILLANTKSTPRDYCNYQSFASQITAEYVVDEVDAYNYDDLGDCKNPNSYFEKISYMGGEVYAFGIVYIFEDGFESPAYHIPGRPADVGERDMVAPWSHDIAHITGVLTGQDLIDYNNNPWVEKWRVYDTAEPPTNGRGRMAFWEMQNGFYYDKDDCTQNFWGVDGYDYSGVGFDNKTPIRHHKFPNRNTIPHIKTGIAKGTQAYIKIYARFEYNDTKPELGQGDILTDITITATDGNGNDITIASGYEVEVNSQGQTTFWASFREDILGNPIVGPLTNFKVSGGVCSDSVKVYINDVLSTTCGGATDPQDVILETNIRYNAIGGSETISLLGINFKNIKLPPGVKSYRIVRAERDRSNRTVLGKAFSGVTRESDNYLTFNGFTESTPGPNLQPNVRINAFNKYIFCPENSFENQDVQPSFIKREGKFIKNYGRASEPIRTEFVQGVDDKKGGWFDNDGYDWQGTSRIDRFSYDEENPPEESNHVVEETIYLPMLMNKQNYETSPTNTVTSRKTAWNIVGDNKIGISRLSSQYTSDDKNIHQEMQYVSLQVERDVHPILDNIKYYKVDNNDSSEPTAENFGGDTFISHYFPTASTQQDYSNVTRVWDFVVKTVIIIVAAAVAAVGTILTAGAAGSALAPGMIALIGVLYAVGATAEIVVVAYQTFSNEKKNNPEFRDITQDNMVTKNDPQPKDDTWYAAMEHIHGAWIESDINVGLREDTSKGLSGYLSSHNPGSANEYCKNKFLDHDFDKDNTSNVGNSVSDTNYRYSYVIKPELYRSNRDFSRQNKEKVFFAFPSNYDCCSLCLEEFPNRILYSQKSFSEERFDSYGKFLPLDYVTVPGEYGEITNIFTIKQALYAHTKSNLWYIPQNIQERVTGDVVSLVGTGGFFQSPPRKIYDDDIGSAGSTQKYATIKTKYGVLFVDDTQGVIYTINFSSQTGTQIQPISLNGLSKWFRNNIPFTLYDNVYQLTKHKLTNRTNPANPNGIGFISCFDYENNRAIITKRDYAISEDYASKEKILITNHPDIREGYNIGNDSNFEDILIYNENDKNWYATNAGNAPYITSLIYLTNQNYFQDKSWTISYSFVSGGWASFHSYLPTFYLYDNRTFYSVKSPAWKIWRHNVEDNYLTYYGRIHSHIIESVAVNNPLLTTLTDDILFQTVAIRNGTEERYRTFNKAVLYNSRQCSNEQLLYPADDNPDAFYMSRSVNNVQGRLEIRKRDKDWMLNGFKDLRTKYDQPIWLNNWKSIQSDYFIDKVLNFDSMDYEKQWTQYEEFRDKYLILRLTLEGITDTKLTTNYLINTEKSVNM